MDELHVTLCSDHFERVFRGDVCDTCPSRAENKAAVMAIASRSREEPDRVSAMVLTELQSIRRAQQQGVQALEDMRAAVYGADGQPGLVAKIAILEARGRQSAASTGTWITVVALVVSSLIALVGLFAAMSGGG